MKPIPWREQLGIVAAGYAVVLLVSVALVYKRHMQYVNHPADVMASSGMYAAGDWMLELFIVALFLIPTFLLVLVIRKSEMAYTKYSQAVLGLSLTAPICLGVSLIPAVNQGNSFLGWFCMDRLFVSPIVIVGLVVSRLLARFGRAKRLTSYALLVEMGTIALVVLLFLFSTGARQG
jgi:hypothetical protein